MIKPPPVSLTTIEDAVGVWKWNIFLDLLLLALCVAMLKHLFLTILLLRSVHSYCVSSQAKIRQICFWILVKNVFFFGLPTLNFVFDGAQALVFGPFFFFGAGSSSIFHWASPQCYQPLWWCLSVQRGLWWETEERDEILGPLFYIGLKTWNKVFFFFFFNAIRYIRMYWFYSES